MATFEDRFAYVVYHDIDRDPSKGDADFDVYIVRGQRGGADNTMVWGAPMRMTDDDVIPKSDQFMPAIVVDEVNGEVHVAWYDTVNDQQSPGQPVKIGLFYRRASDTVNGMDWGFLPVMLDGIAIDTTKLSNGAYLGDHIDMTVVDGQYSPNLKVFVVVTYVGTMRSGGIGRAPDPSTTNENIYSVTIEQISH